MQLITVPDGEGSARYLEATSRGWPTSNSAAV
jgi:hypothetical protein